MIDSSTRWTRIRDTLWKFALGVPLFAAMVYLTAWGVNHGW